MQEQVIPPGLCQCGCGGQTTRIAKSNASKGLVRGEYRKFVHGHQRRWTGADYDVDASTGCWNWRKGLKPDGYGRTRHNGRDVLAHRLYFERHIGPIPDGLVIDHLCRNRRCVNPAHMQAVSNAENVMRGFSVPAIKARQTHCKRGHEFTPENTYISKDGHRDCRACHRIDQLAWKRKQKSEPQRRAAQ